MKTASKSVLLLSLGMLGAAGALASSLEQTYLDTCRKDPRIPVPIAVVTPAVSADYSGAHVDVQFIVDELGRPTNLTVQSAPDDTLSSAVMEAIKQWKFKPAERNGIPVATKVVLPVKIVDLRDGSVFAAN